MSASVPSSWRRVELGTICRLINGRGFKPHEWSTAGLPIIRIQNLNGSEAFNYFNGEFDPKVLVKDGDLLFAWSGSRGSSFGPHIWRGRDAVLNYHTWRIEVETGTEKLFLYQLLKFVTEAVERETHGQASLVHTQKGTMEKFSILLPPIEEQRKIENTLAEWDRAIETAEALVAAKRQIYEAARQRLIDDHQRHGNVDDGWESSTFGDLAEELGERNRGRLGSSSVMGVLKSQGIVPMREHVMASDLDRYLVVPPGAFAYNPMRLNIGSIAQSAHPADILVSPDYVVFSARAGEGSAAFLRHFIGSKRWRDTMELAATGSVRLRIYFDGLAEMTLRAPPLDLQERIAMVLDAAQTEMALANKTLESLRTQKRGLMQKLLTGEWRLPAKASEQAV